jgi:hypothetical protein
MCECVCASVAGVVMCIVGCRNVCCGVLRGVARLPEICGNIYTYVLRVCAYLCVYMLSLRVCACLSVCVRERVRVRVRVCVCVCVTRTCEQSVVQSDLHFGVLRGRHPVYHTLDLILVVVLESDGSGVRRCWLWCKKVRVLVLESIGSGPSG